MKPSIIGSEIKSNGVINKERFGFNLDAYSFELLSKNLYSDGILAMLREYTTNALDAIKDAGNEDKGYIVHLPNTLEPFFSIRDFGTGIPDEEMADLFTFNASTKRDTNERNGLFGLGSKSFLAVSDSATFTTFYNGRKHVYFVYKDKGLPSYTKIEESETTEENGLEVKIPIKSHQFFALIEKYKVFCRYVDVLPTIVGYDKEKWNESLKVYKDTVVDLGEGCFIEKEHTYYPNLKVVFGNVAYPTNIRLNDVIKSNCLIHIPIGSVDIVPSREELRMSEKTINYLKTLKPALTDRIKI
jgi:HSP90 family molecular chaperone